LKIHEAQKEDSAEITAMSSATWENIANTLHQSDLNTKSRRHLPIWWAAAILLLALGVVWLVRDNQHSVRPSSLLLSEEAGYVVKRNLGHTSMQVFLPDGSKVSLEPGASLKSKTLLNDTLREVILQGDAFFEIAKDTDRPFIVHTDYIYTRVLGTSFWILTAQGAQQQTVAVKTGKVSVSDILQQETEILLPNEQLTYDDQRRVLIKSRIDPSVIQQAPAMQQIALQFQDTSVPTILDSLSSAYGVKIIYDRQTLAHCRVTTSLSSESLYEKLDILCKATGASYRPQDDKLYVTGGSCQ